MKHCYRAGIDIGSTTAKLVILDERGVLCYGDYRRHCAHTQETLAELLEDACAKLGPCDLRLKITGSGAINLGKALNIGFVQEVVAVASSLQAIAPQTDVAIELGGEDAKIIYFRGGLEERMNGVCAGGTGSFIDQMAALLQTDAEGLNRAAADYRELYPIAARCGVFAKSDIQPLINEGATLPDLAASIFQAVVNQTISGLACGKPIRGCVAFLGGPLHFLPELKKAFIRTLHLTPENIVDPDNSHLFAAMGAALEAVLLHLPLHQGYRKCSLHRDCQNSSSQCFSEYSRKVLSKAKSNRVPIREQLQQAADQLSKEKPKQKERAKEVTHEDR